MKKYSKSECFLRLSNKETRNAMAATIAQDARIRIPSSIIPVMAQVFETARETGDLKIISNCGRNSLEAAANCSEKTAKRTYGIKLMDGMGNKRRIKLQGKRKTFVRDIICNLIGTTEYSISASKLVELSSMLDLRILRYLIGELKIEVPTDLKFERFDHKVFYSTLLIRVGKTRAGGLQFLRMVENTITNYLYKQIPEDLKMCMRYAMFSINMGDIENYLKSSVTNIDRAIQTLIFVRKVLPDRLPELCFSGLLEFNKELFKNMHTMNISQQTQYSENIAESFLSFKHFKQVIFNGWKNEQFIQNMRAFCNRADFKFYFKEIGVEHAPEVRLPRDYMDYEFFMTENSICEFSVLSNYCNRWGMTPPLKLYLKKHSKQFFNKVVDGGAVEALGTDTFQQLIGFAINEVASSERTLLWEVLCKRNKSVLRKIYPMFLPFLGDINDEVLYGLLSGKYNFEPKEVIKYINTGWDEELLQYFSSLSVSDVLSVISLYSEDWSFSFFSDVILRFLNDLQSCNLSGIHLSGSDISQIVRFLEMGRTSTKKANRKIASHLYSIIMQIDDVKVNDLLYEIIPDELKFIFAGLREKFLKKFIGESENQVKENIRNENMESDNVLVLHKLSQLYELDRSYDFELFYQSFAAIMNVSSFDQNEFDSLFCPECPIESLFAISYVFPHFLKFYFVEYFDLLVKTIDENISKTSVLEIVRWASTNLLDAPTGYGEDRILYLTELNVLLKERSNYTISNRNLVVSYLFKRALSDSQVLLILFEKLTFIISEVPSPTKILILAFLDTSALPSGYSHSLISLLVPILSGTNTFLASLSRSSLLKADIATPEIRKILPEIIEACSDSKFVPLFFNIIRSITFNNYFSLNSLAFILQILISNLDSFTDDVLDILLRLPQVISDCNMIQVGSYLFRQLAEFVTTNSYSSSKVQPVAQKFAKYSSFDSFLPLIRTSSNLHVARFITTMLHEKNDSELNKQIISHIISTPELIKPALISAACELDEINDSLPSLLPFLFDLFVSELQSERDAAGNAFLHILKNERCHEYSINYIEPFIRLSALFGEHPVKLAALNLTTYLPIIYILRNDKHLLVRKMATERWKSVVSHTGRAVRSCLKEIVEFLVFSSHKSICTATDGVASELAVKYTGELSEYLKMPNDLSSSASYTLFSDCFKKYPKLAKYFSLDGFNLLDWIGLCEYLFLNLIKAGKLLDEALNFHIAHGSLEIFQHFLQDDRYKVCVLSKTPSDFILGVLIKLRSIKAVKDNNMDENIDKCAGKTVVQRASKKVDKKTGKKIDKNADNKVDEKVGECVDELPSNIAFSAYLVKRDLRFVSYMKEKHKIQILKEENEMENSMFIAELLSDSLMAEEYLMNAHPDIISSYLKRPRSGFGKLTALFQRLFASGNNIEPFIVPKNMKYIKECSFERINDFSLLLKLLIQDEERSSFQRTIEILNKPSVFDNIELPLVFEVLGFLLHSFLLKSRREHARAAILKIHHNLTKHGADLGHFEKIISTCVFK